MPESLRVKIKKLHYQGIFNDSQTERLLKLLEMEKRKKTGHWIGTEYDGYADGNPVYDAYECSECGAEFCGEDFDFDYCPRCGAKMEVSE